MMNVHFSEKLSQITLVSIFVRRTSEFWFDLGLLTNVHITQHDLEKSALIGMCLLLYARYIKTIIQDKYSKYFPAGKVTSLGVKVNKYV